MSGIGRFQIVNTLDKQPGCCFFCRGIKTPVLDTRHWIPGQGTIYICEVCLAEMGLELFGKPEKVVTEVSTPLDKDKLDGLADDLRNIVVDLSNVVSFVGVLSQSTTQDVVVEEPGDSAGVSEGSDTGDKPSGKSKQSPAK